VLGRLERTEGSDGPRSASATEQVPAARSRRSRTSATTRSFLTCRPSSSCSRCWQHWTRCAPLRSGRSPRRCWPSCAVETCCGSPCARAATRARLVLAGSSRPRPQRALRRPGGSLGDGRLAGAPPFAARLCAPWGAGTTSFRRTARRQLRGDPAVDALGARGGFLVLPFNVSGEVGGALVLQSLTAPAAGLRPGAARSRWWPRSSGKVFTVARNARSPCRGSAISSRGRGRPSRGVRSRTSRRACASHEENIVPAPDAAAHPLERA
jgi:hypothetical protein